MKKMNKKGFTLIEMLAVIAIIAVLVAIIVPAVGSSTTKAKAATDAANLRSVLSAATIEYAEKGNLTDLSMDAPKAKSITTGTKIEIHMVGDSLVAYYTNGSDYYDIAAFSAVANGDKDASGNVITTPTKLTTAPTTTALATITCK